MATQNGGYEASGDAEYEEEEELPSYPGTYRNTRHAKNADAYMGSGVDDVDCDLSSSDDLKRERGRSSTVIYSEVQEKINWSSHFDKKLVNVPSLDKLKQMDGESKRASKEHLKPMQELIDSKRDWNEGMFITHLYSI